MANKSIIYNNYITNITSIISIYKSVRKEITKLQIDYIKNTNNNLVLDGRDCATNIAPCADIKFFITAKANIRAQRRLKQEKKEEHQLHNVRKEIEKRDERDQNREHNPLLKDIALIQNNYFIIDNSSLEMNNLMHYIYQIIDKELNIPNTD